MTKPTREETDKLWAEYKLSPDYSNVFRWLNSDRTVNPEHVEASMKWLFRSAILCATDPSFLERGEPAHDAPEDQSNG